MGSMYFPPLVKGIISLTAEKKPEDFFCIRMTVYWTLLLRMLETVTV